MRKFNVLLITLLLLAFGTMTQAANVADVINYQGRLTDDADNPVPDGDYDIDFAIYGLPTSGSWIWSEGHVAVPVKDGLFSVLLGTHSELTGVFDSPNRYLGITVGEDEEITPRVRITSSAYAYRVETIDGANGGEIDGPITSFHDGQDWYMVPEGAIIMWSGLLTEIPSGWALCDGNNGTPDLTDRFIWSVGTGENPGASGGTQQHSHMIQAINFSDQPSSNAVRVDAGNMHDVSRREHNHQNQIPSFSTEEESSLPPYYKLAFIMRVHAAPPR